MSDSFLSDSTYATSLAHDLVERDLAKHIGVHVYYTRAQVHDGVIALQYVPSELRLANLFTKSQTYGHHQFSLSKFSVLDPP
jgi:hypothetical protein